MLVGDRAGALGEQRDQERQDPVDVVEPLGGLAAETRSSSAAERDLDDDRGLRDPQRVPEADRGLAQVPATAPQTPAARFAARTVMPRISCRVTIASEL